MYSKKRKNVYRQSVRAVDLDFSNCPREIFRKKLESLPYLMYKVEELEDGRAIVINKPGGKRVFGRVARQDFMVWIHDTTKQMFWLISHKDILDDLYEKSDENALDTIKLIKLMERVFNGEEPNEIMKEICACSFQVGESPELLIKAYKWIWGQEDCNYPPPKYQGREMSMKGIIELKNKLTH